MGELNIDNLKSCAERRKMYGLVICSMSGIILFFIFILALPLFDETMDYSALVPSIFKGMAPTLNFESLKEWLATICWLGVLLVGRSYTLSSRYLLKFANTAEANEVKHLMNQEIVWGTKGMTDSITENTERYFPQLVRWSYSLAWIRPALIVLLFILIYHFLTMEAPALSVIEAPAAPAS